MAEGRPNIDKLWDLVTDTIAEYSTRDSSLSELEDYYFLEQSKKDKEAEEEGVEVVHLPYGTNAVDLVQDLFGDAELAIVVPAASQGPEAKKLADVAEKYLQAIFQQSERAQRQSFLARAAWLVAMRGCLAGRVMAIQNWISRTEEGTWEVGQRVPLLLQLRDPLYVYPAFGLDGLAYVVEKRTRLVRDLRNSLGDEVLPDQELTEEVEWIEYWDDEWFCYWADGKAINLGAGKGPWPHRYGGIPYGFEFARQTGKTQPEKRVRPLLKAVQTVIDRMGLLDSAEATFIMDYNGDALNIYSDAEKEYDKRSGAINYLDKDDRVEWLRASRQPMELAGAHNKYNHQLQKGTFPDTVYGMDPGRVVSGYTINQLNQSGQIRIRPLISCMERFLSDLMENALMVSENYLTDLVGGAIPFYLVAEREDEAGQRYRSREAQKLDAKKFGGWYQVEVSLGELMPADEQANLMLALKSREPGPDGRPMLSWETSVDKWGLVSSPADEKERIDREAAWNDPQVVLLRQALYAAQIKQELSDELAKLDIDADALLTGLGQGAMPSEGLEQPLPQEQPGQTAMLPPDVLPPQLQGEPVPALPDQLEQPILRREPRSQVPMPTRSRRR